MVRIACKRAYDPAAHNDGSRILVDRIWPRGIRKEALKLDDWYKEIAPSSELRKWFKHDPKKWEEFRERYWRELEDHRSLADDLIDRKKRNKITLIYGARDSQHNHALVLKDFLEQESRQR